MRRLAGRSAKREPTPDDFDVVLIDCGEADRAEQSTNSYRPPIGSRLSRVRARARKSSNSFPFRDPFSAQRRRTPARARGRLARGVRGAPSRVPRRCPSWRAACCRRGGFAPVAPNWHGRAAGRTVVSSRARDRDPRTGRVRPFAGGRAILERARCRTISCRPLRPWLPPTRRRPLDHVRLRPPTSRADVDPSNHLLFAGADRRPGRAIRRGRRLDPLVDAQFLRRPRLCPGSAGIVRRRLSELVVAVHAPPRPLVRRGRRPQALARRRKRRLPVRRLRSDRDRDRRAAPVESRFHRL